jgi:predicted metal-dependent HD superfamily phosphohydrolase
VVYRVRVFECRHQPFALPAPLAAELAAAYGEPHRAYHNLTHIAEVLHWYDAIADDLTWQQPAEIYAAILFHDAIYVSGAKDNEARSADWAKRSALPVDTSRVAALILLTARHGHLDSADRDASLFLDSDMAILGSPPSAFAAYDAAIAREYSHLPADAYAAGRKQFLTTLLAKPRIYLTDYFHNRLDAQARVNLGAALTS